MGMIDIGEDLCFTIETPFPLVISGVLWKENLYREWPLQSGYGYGLINFAVSAFSNLLFDLVFSPI